MHAGGVLPLPPAGEGAWGHGPGDNGPRGDDVMHACKLYSRDLLLPFMLR